MTRPESGRFPTISAKLPEGVLVEMLLRDGKPSFACYADGNIVERTSVDGASGQVLVPYSPENNLLTHRVVLLPSEAAEYGTKAALLAEVRAFIHRYVDLSKPFETVAAAYVLLTWIYDDFPELPYLRARGAFGSGKSRFLLTLGSVCYKPIFASGASTVSPLFRMLDAVEGTLVLDEADFRLSDERAEIVKILNNGNAKGFPVLRSELTPQKEFNPRAFSVFGPKVIATRHPFEDEALESRCLTEEMGLRTVRADIPTSLPDTFHAEAEALRNALLMYRFREFGRPRDDVTLEGVSPRRRQVLSPLLKTLEGEQRGELRLALRALVGGESFAPEVRLEASLLEAIATLQNRGTVLTVKAIAVEASATRGETFSPRQVGHLLRHSLGLLPERRGGVYLLAAGAEARIDMLLERHGVGQDVGDVEDISQGSMTEN